MHAAISQYVSCARSGFTSQAHWLFSSALHRHLQHNKQTFHHDGSMECLLRGRCDRRVRSTCCQRMPREGKSVFMLAEVYWYNGLLPRPHLLPEPVRHQVLLGACQVHRCWI